MAQLLHSRDVVAQAEAIQVRALCFQASGVRRSRQRTACKLGVKLAIQVWMRAPSFCCLPCLYRSAFVTRRCHPCAVSCGPTTRGLVWDCVGIQAQLAPYPADVSSHLHALARWAASSAPLDIHGCLSNPRFLRAACLPTTQRLGELGVSSAPGAQAAGLDALKRTLADRGVFYR